MGERVLILSCDKWRMTDEKSGEVMQGWSMWYVNDYREDEAESFGLKPTKMSLRDDKMALALRGQVPCLAEFEMSSRPGAGNKAAVFARSIEVLQPNVDLVPSAPRRAA